MSDTRDDMLYQICPICKGTGMYQICPICKGTGKLPRDPQGFTRECYCKSLRVVAASITTG